LIKKGRKKSSLKEIPGGKNFELTPVDTASLLFIQHAGCHFDVNAFSHRAQTRSFHPNDQSRRRLANPEPPWGNSLYPEQLVS